MVYRFLLNKVKRGLSKTRDLFTGIGQILRLKGRVDKPYLEELERLLLQADVGTDASSAIVQDVRQAFLDKEVAGDVEAFVKQKLQALLTGDDLNLRFALDGPSILLVAGVNGSGKTTSIAKLAYRLHEQGKKVVVAACDTFRAAAVEQLTIWSQRIGCEIVKSQQGSDPASVAHDACAKAQARNLDVVIVDTAGRLHTQAHLMNELEKIHRVVKKQISGAPHEVLLVLDANTGQNAIVQAQKFTERIHCTGIILTKLDGTSKGGTIFSIKQKLGLPVKFIGVGEQLDDLEPFDPATYVEALFAEQRQDNNL